MVVSMDLLLELKNQSLGSLGRLGLKELFVTVENITITILEPLKFAINRT